MTSTPAFRLLLLGSAALASALLTPAAAQQQNPAQQEGSTPQSPPPPRFGVPANYLGRFSGLSPVLETDDKSDITKLGLAGIPLPAEQDWRVLLVRRPDYWDYTLSTRKNDTTYLVGKLDNIWRGEAVHDPYTGPQFRALLSFGGFSELSGGYAFTALDGKARILSKVGVAASGDIRTPFGYTQAGGTFGTRVGAVNFSVTPQARVYLYPFETSAYGSAEVVFAANTALTPQLLLEANHLERWSAGRSVIPEFAQSRAQETNLSATYRLPVEGDPAFGLGAVRGSYSHNWQNQWDYLRGDVLLRSSSLPVMMGPRLEYRSGPDGQGRWVYGLVTLGK